MEAPLSDDSCDSEIKNMKSQLTGNYIKIDLFGINTFYHLYQCNYQFCVLFVFSELH